MKPISSLVLAQDFPPIPGGVSVYVENLFKNWKQPVIIQAPESPEPSNIEFPPNVIIKRLSMDLKRGGLTPYLKRQIGLYRASTQQIKSSNIDIVHCTHIASGLVALLLKKFHALPYVLYTYGSEITGQPGFIRSTLSRLILKNALHIVTMSEFTKKAIMAYGIPSGRIRFLVGVEVDRFTNKGDTKATRKKYDIQGEPVLLTVARLVKHKGIDTVIRALPEIVKKYPKLLYLVIGEGEYRNHLKKMCKKLHVEKHVKFLGNIPHNLMQNESEAFYSICDLFIMVSRNLNGIEAEGFGIVFLEAGLSNKACIGGNSGGISDAVIDGVTGKLVDPHDPGDVAEKVLFMLDNRKTAIHMGQNGFERAIQNYDWQANVKAWEEELNVMSSNATARL